MQKTCLEPWLIYKIILKLRLIADCLTNFRNVLFDIMNLKLFQDKVLCDRNTTIYKKILYTRMSNWQTTACQ